LDSDPTPQKATEATTFTKIHPMERAAVSVLCGGSVLDPNTGQAKHIPTDFAGDILYAGWTSDGQILAMGLNTEGSIWRFRPQ